MTIPSHFAKVRGWREHPAQMVRELFHVEPDAWQEEALEAFPTSPRIAMKSCKGPGKTCVLAWIAWNFLLTRPHPKCAATSISGDNLKTGFWTEMAKWRNVSPLLQELFEWTKTEIFSKEHRATWKMEARTWSKDANPEQVGETLAGIHAEYVLFILDESGGYPDSIMPTAEAIFAGEPKEAHIVQAGNPTNLSGPLYRACTSSRGLWKVIEITADPDNPKRTPRVSVEHAREQIQQYGRDNAWVLVNIFGEFPPSSLNVLIGPDEVSAAMKRYYREYEIGNAPRVMGVDVARFGDDASVIWKRQGIQCFKPVKQRNIDSTQGAGIVSREWTDFGADAVFIDDTGGFGSGWIDHLRLLGRSPIGVPFSGMAHNKGRYVNKRAEMYFEAVDWIKRGGALPESNELLAALTQTTYTFQGDRFLLEPKDQVKLKLGYSPDEADAFCFVAGTRIAIPGGDAPIEDVATGDVVLTPLGSARVVKTWRTKADRLTTVRLTNGSVLKGRPEHKVFTFSNGATRLDALSLTMALSPLSERSKWRSASALFTAVRRIGFKTAVDILAQESPSTVSGCCIAVSGLSAMDRFHQGTKFITRMGIGETLVSIISKCLPSRSIGGCTPVLAASSPSVRNRSAAIFDLPGKRPRSGIDQRRAGNGIARTVFALGRSELPSAVPACGVDRPSGLSTRRKPAFAPRAVRWLRRTEDILRTCARATGAERLSRRIGIVGPPVVPVSVATGSVPPTFVYNLTLEADNAYYANGILVFNCLTFAEPVTPARQGRVRQRHQFEYDPFAERPLASAVAESYDPFR